MKNQDTKRQGSKGLPENFNEEAADKCVHPRRANVTTEEHCGKENLGEAEAQESNKSKLPGALNAQRRK